MSNINFTIDESPLSNIRNSSFKFLGTEIFSNKQRKNTFKAINGIITGLIKDIDGLPIRGSYKVNLYKLYATAKVRFPLMVHDLVSSQLDKLDRTVRNALRKWHKLPTSTNVDLFLSRKGINIQLPSDIYNQGHVTLESSPSDQFVKDALEEKAESSQLANTEYRNSILSDSRLQNLKTLKSNRERKIEGKAKTFGVQGNWHSLFCLQEKDSPFQSLLKGLSESTHRWLIMACTDTLPTNAYLKRIN